MHTLALVLSYTHTHTHPHTHTPTPTHTHTASWWLVWPVLYWRSVVQVWQAGLRQLAYGQGGSCDCPMIHMWSNERSYDLWSPCELRDSYSCVCHVIWWPCDCWYPYTFPVLIPERRSLEVRYTRYIHTLFWNLAVTVYLKYSIMH